MSPKTVAPRRISRQEFDLQPHPRILAMLGEINLEQWRCVAELIDNSVDAFINDARRGGGSTAPAEVHVSLPMSENGDGRITVRDTACGMDAATLENAVRAGWTGNDPISNLGMFGMGFNIATARLGTLTRVWTTRRGDREWCGLEIDFAQLMRQKHFKTPRLSKPKKDPQEQGTEITIEHLKPEQRQWFSKAPNRSKINKALGLAYSAMLRPNGVPLAFKLTVNGNLILGKQHCIWGGEANSSREIRTSRFGVVNAYQPIDIRLTDRPFCSKCWYWLPADEKKCPECGRRDDVVVRQRRVYGWLGIQRFLSTTDYGIDFLRHGRKIEIANKDLFTWHNGEAPELEYPIDDPRHRGRIVGEIHLDHCRAVYTKDRFDRNDPAWEDMVKIVRGEGPLRPDKAAELGVGQNISPLYLLFQAFRRSNPKTRVAGDYARLLVVPDNDLAEEMAERFYSGDPEYQTDVKWWTLVEEADRRQLTPNPSPTSAGNSGGLDDFGGAQAGTNGASTTASTPPPAPTRFSIPSLSRQYRDDATDQKWDIKAFRAERTDPDLQDRNRPWRLTANADGTHQFLLDPSHPIFQSATMTPLDALVSELAWAAMDFQRGTPSNATFATVLAGLRDRYAGIHKLDPPSLAGEAGLTLSAIARSVSTAIGGKGGKKLFDELSKDEQTQIQQRMAVRSVKKPQKMIEDGQFLDFAPRKSLIRFVERHPDLFFDGKYWDAGYASLDYGKDAATKEARSGVLRYYTALLSDAVWLAEQDPADLSQATRARILRSALALELLVPATDTDSQE